MGVSRWEPSTLLCERVSERVFCLRIKEAMERNNVRFIIASVHLTIVCDCFIDEMKVILD